MKLSTEKLRSLLTTWICTSKMQEILTLDESNPIDDHEFNYWRNELKLKSSATKDDINKARWKLWCNVKQWKRVDKYRLSDGEWKYYLFAPDESNKDYSFASDLYVDDCNKDLVKYYFDHPDKAEKLIYRMLAPTNAFGENYRIQIVTTHNDDDIVGWCVSSD